MSAGTVIGVPLGIYISSIYNWRLTMWFIVLIGLLGMIAMVGRFPVLPTSSLPTWRERLSMFQNRQVALVMLVTAILSFCSLGLYTYLDRIISAYGYGQSIWFIWMWGIGGITGSFLIGSIMDRWKRPRAIMLILILALLLALLLMNAVHPYATGLCILLILWGAAGWSSIAAQQRTLVEISPQHATISIALLSSVNYLSGSLGTMSFGAMLGQSANPANLPSVAGTILIAAIMLQGLWLARRSSIHSNSVQS